MKTLNFETKRIARRSYCFFDVKNEKRDKNQGGNEKQFFPKCVSQSTEVCGVLLTGLFGSAAAAPAISSKAIGAKPSPEVSKYFSSVKDWGERYNFGASTEEVDWLLLGFQTWLRFENFDNVYRRPKFPSGGGSFYR